MPETPNKKQLYDLVWKRPMVEVAKEYGLSDRGLAKLCERHGIPVPPRGYWAKKKAGQKVIRPPLLLVDPKEPATKLIIKHAVKKQKALPSDSIQPSEPAFPEEIMEAIERELLLINKVVVPKTLASPHSVIAKWIQEEERDTEIFRKYGGWCKPRKLTELEKRRRRIISALLKALECRGFKVEADQTYKQFIRVKHEWDEMGFTVSERIRQHRRELTAEEKKESSYSSKWRQISEPTGLLMLRISREFRGGSYSGRDFQETPQRPLEDQLNDIISAFIEKIWLEKKARLARRAEEERRWDQQKERERLEKLLQEENDRKAALSDKAFNWKKSHDIREYVAAVLAACDRGSLNVDVLTLATWREWALAHAEELDPITAGMPLIDLPEMESEDKSEDV